MLPSFKDMKVPEQIIEALKNMGITKPMPVQAQAIPALYAGRDVIARAQTGTRQNACLSGAACAAH